MTPLQATLAADTTYFFIVDGFNGAYGIWQFSLAALDNSTVEGSLLSGSYGLAVPGTSTTTTTSKTTLHDLSLTAKLLEPSNGCECTPSQVWLLSSDIVCGINVDSAHVFDTNVDPCVSLLDPQMGVCMPCSNTASSYTL